MIRLLSVRGRKFRKANPARQQRMLAAMMLDEFYGHRALGRRWAQVSPSHWPALPEIELADVATIQDRSITGKPRKLARLRVHAAIKKAFGI